VSRERNLHKEALRGEERALATVGRHANHAYVELALMGCGRPRAGCLETLGKRKKEGVVLRTFPLHLKLVQAALRPRLVLCGPSRPPQLSCLSSVERPRPAHGPARGRCSGGPKTWGMGVWTSVPVSYVLHTRTSVSHVLCCMAVRHPVLCRRP
jgi:hypothetical protein